MAVSTTGYDQSVRQLLQGKGVDNNAIGYSNGYVTVNGQNFIKPAKTYNNTAYDSTQNFNNAWNTYQQSLKQPTSTTPTTTATNPGYTPTAGSAIAAGSNLATNSGASTPSYGANQGYTNPIDQKVNDTLSQIMRMIQQPQQVNVNDIYSSPQYAAEQAQAQKQAQQAIRAAQEAFGASGFGRSSELAQSAQGIQNDANTYLQTQVLPQLIAQAQNDQQQKLQNQLSLLGQLQSAQGVYDTRYNNAQDLALRKGESLGNYVSPEASALINQILQDKQNYAAATTPEARQQANADANSIRAQLAALGYSNVDQLLGAGQTMGHATANQGRVGIPTLAAQGQQFSQNLQNRQQDLTETQINAELTGFMPDGTPTNQYQQQQLTNLWKAADESGVIPDTLADMYKIKRGTPTQQAKEFALNYNRGVLESDRSYNRGVLESDRNYNLDLSREGRLAAEDSNTTTDPYKQLNDVASIIDKSAQYTTDSKDVSGKKVLANSDAVEKQILNSGLPEYQMWQLYQRYGIPWQGAIPSPN